jgi:hypothetical protein
MTEMVRKDNPVVVWKIAGEMSIKRNYETNFDQLKT